MFRGLTDKMGLNPRDGKFITEQERIVSHFGTRLFPQCGHRRRRQVGKDDVKAAKVERGIITSHKFGRIAGKSRTQKTGNPWQRRGLDSDETAFRSTPGKMHDQSAESAANIDEPDWTPFREQFMNGTPHCVR